jgi:hypothetical protein
VLIKLLFHIKNLYAGLKYLPLLYVLVKHFGAHIDVPNDAGETCLLLAIKLNDAKLDNCVVADVSHSEAYKLA